MDILLGVCVLSARGNYEQRAAIRNSWFKNAAHSSVGHNKTVLRFVLGNQACPLHPADRVDEYGCQEWSPEPLQDYGADVEAFTNSESVERGPQVGRISIREEMTSVQFSTKDPGVVHKGFRYQPVEPVMLQK
ncbi:hypothetical protein BaRGS_00021698, partial [Batillaria attramentaria]